MQVQMVPEDTVEDTLEEAIFKAGGILESNRGQQSKVGGWRRGAGRALVSSPACCGGAAWLARTCGHWQVLGAASVSPPASGAHRPVRPCALCLC